MCLPGIVCLNKNTELDQLTWEPWMKPSPQHEWWMVGGGYWLVLFQPWRDQVDGGETVNEDIISWVTWRRILISKFFFLLFNLLFTWLRIWKHFNVALEPVQSRSRNQDFSRGPFNPRPTTAPSLCFCVPLAGVASLWFAISLTQLLY